MDARPYLFAGGALIVLACTTRTHPEDDPDAAGGPNSTPTANSGLAVGGEGSGAGGEGRPCDGRGGPASRNWGWGGHDCQGGEGTAGQCQPVEWAPGQAFRNDYTGRWVAGDETHVYWAGQAVKKLGVGGGD